MKTLIIILITSVSIFAQKKLANDSTIKAGKYHIHTSENILSKKQKVKFIPYAKLADAEAHEASIYAMGNDSVFFKPCEGKRIYIGDYDRKINAILLKR